MSRENKFGYGFLLAGVGMPYLIERLFGATAATAISAVCVVLGIAFLVAGHRHGKPMTGLGFAVAIGCLLGAIGTILYLWHSPRPILKPNTPALSFDLDLAKERLNSHPDELTLHDLYLLDFPSEAQYQTGLTILSSNTHLEWAVVWNIAEGSELIKLYIPHSTETAGIVQGFIPNHKGALKEANEFKIKNRDQISSRTLTFSNRIYAYNYDYLSAEEVAALGTAYKSAGLILVLRDMNYLEMRRLEAKLKLSQK